MTPTRAEGLDEFEEANANGICHTGKALQLEDVRAPVRLHYTLGLKLELEVGLTRQPAGVRIVMLKA